MEKDKNNKIPVRPESVSEKGANDKHNIAQTYVGDMAKVIEDDRGGLVKKLIDEEQAREEAKHAKSPDSRKNKLFMFFSFLFMLAGLAVISFFFLQPNLGTQEVAPQFSPVIFNDATSFFEIAGFDRDEVVQTILSASRDTEVKSRGVEGIYLTENKQIVGLRKFISLLEASFAPGGDTVFVSDSFLMGVVNIPSEQNFFILLQMRSLPDIFDSLRAWEAKMFADLQDLFDASSSPETRYLLTKEFQNGIVENKNARMLYDQDGNLVLMYVFANDSSVVIAGSEEVAKEVMLRLAAGNVKK